jgi:putative membrane protein insertion efficiency factor
MVRALLLWLLRVYRFFVSPLLGDVCRFEPSCSRYASACVERFGAARGSWLAAKRLCKCHPFHPGGYDPPPELPPSDQAGATRATAGRT